MWSESGLHATEYTGVPAWLQRQHYWYHCCLAGGSQMCMRSRIMQPRCSPAWTNVDLNIPLLDQIFTWPSSPTGKKVTMDQSKFHCLYCIVPSQVINSSKRHVPVTIAEPSKLHLPESTAPLWASTDFSIRPLREIRWNLPIKCKNWDVLFNVKKLWSSCQPCTSIQ